MHKQELKDLLKKYREQPSSREDQRHLWSLVFDEKNEDSIKEEMIEDLDHFEVSHQELNGVDFQGIFKKVETAIGVSDAQFTVEHPAMRKNSFSINKILRIASILIITFLCGGIFSYFFFKPHEEASVISYNEVTAPLGARSEVLLPDGSKVWLNAGSKIRYLNVFNKANRIVLLEGEAYFKVAKNPDLPFNVKAGDLNIVAIGTEFNVKSYVDEGIIETTLVEGKVSIRHNRQRQKKSEMIFLEAHQKAVYVKEDQKLTVEDLKAVRQTKPEVLNLKRGIMYIADKIDPEPIVSWKDNRLILKGEELSNLLIKLERKYDVTFVYETDMIKDFRFTGTLENETLTQVLDVIKLSAPIDYDLDGKTVRIKENKQMSKKFSGHLKKK